MEEVKVEEKKETKIEDEKSPVVSAEKKEAEITQEPVFSTPDVNGNEVKSETAPNFKEIVSLNINLFVELYIL